MTTAEPDRMDWDALQPDPDALTPFTPGSDIWY